jgi:arsenical pump membrane protein
VDDALALVALAAALVAAVARDRRAPEALVALGGAAVLLAAGVLGPAAAWDEAKALGPTLALLAALLVLGDGCDRAGLFDALAVRIAAAARGSGPRLLTFTVLAAAGVTAHGLGDAVDGLVPAGDGLGALLAAAAIAAVLANVLNNLPALLVLLPAAASAGPSVVLAVLIGVNAGPNLTYTGSLATLLWRRVLHERDAAPDLGAFTRLGLLTVPPILASATVALWLALRVL